MTDLVERLRHEAEQWHPSEKSPIRHLHEAADEIERLRTRKELPSSSDLVKALQWFIDDIDGSHTVMRDFDANVELARSALRAHRGEGK